VRGEDVTYSKHTIPLTRHEDIHQVLRRFSHEQHLVVLNVATAAAMRPVFLCEENLSAVLAGAPAELCVEALPRGAFRTLACDRIAESVQASLSLRVALRTQRVVDLASQANSLLSQLHQLVLLLECAVLQGTQPAAADNVRTLRNVSAQFAGSSFEHGDNVRCMDDLQYEILPTLRDSLKLFGK
jgi:hypothetical protein